MYVWKQEEIKKKKEREKNYYDFLCLVSRGKINGKKDISVFFFTSIPT